VNKEKPAPRYCATLRETGAVPWMIAAAIVFIIKLRMSVVALLR
jgi:hypothetical protein